MRHRFALFAALVFAASPALAGDEPATPPAPKSEPSSGPNGFHCKVTLVNGRVVTGVVVASGTWERRNTNGAWEGCARDDAGAAIRLRFVGGADGELLLAAKQVASAENQGPVVQADLDRQAAMKAEAEKNAKEERDRLRILRKQRADARAEADQRAAAEAATAAKDAAEAAKAKAIAEILAKFPPPDWGPERLEKIKHRRLIMDLLPTALEREFMERYDEWVRADAAQQEADAKAGRTDTGKTPDSGKTPDAGKTPESGKKPDAGKK